ncbi:MAG: hypothetical protein JWO99_557 [Candidatus Saccharibacteria bacterium]|nr:hypothetical protein [Candidatus Saccharibacteria bacterium]
MNPDTQPTPVPTPETPVTPVAEPTPVPEFSAVPAPAPDLAPTPAFAQQPIQVTINNQTAAVAVPGTKSKNFIVALLLSIFLGGLGIDRFYLGSIGLGVLKLLTGGVFGILYIIDIILIATKNVKGINWVE